MATKTEKIIGTVLGSFTGAWFGYNYAKNNNVPENERWKYIIGWGAGGAIGGYGLSAIFGSPNDTVNYKLHNGRKIVYHGITFKNRIDYREYEHIRSGKIFSKMVVDKPKPRVEALSKEKELIIKHKPLYNIHHNY